MGRTVYLGSFATRSGAKLAYRQACVRMRIAAEIEAATIDASLAAHWSEPDPLRGWRSGERSAKTVGRRGGRRPRDKKVFLCERMRLAD
jgi:hypothetical protein